MTLTVKEKEHWKASIDRKVQRAIDAIYAEGEPSFRDRILKESRRKALQSLGIEELQNRNIAISDQLRVLQEEQRELEKKLADAVKARCSEYKVEYSYQFSLEAAIRLRQKRFERELLNENELGQKILRLQDEQEELLDTVWLATSSSQIKELWSRVSKLLDQPPTGLQREALDIPADSSSPKE